jgi:hypothetical protein
VRDFYEAYTVYNFLSLLIAILGRDNRDVVVNVLAQHASHLKPPTKCLSSCYHPAPETSDQAMANAVLYECQVLVMQFVFCRPLTSIASFVSTTLMINRQDNDENDNWALLKTPNFYISMITNVSVFLAFTGLLKFYHAVRDDLLWCQPFSKFMAIKGIVFLTFWQGLLITIFVSLHEVNNKKDDSSTSKSPQQLATELQHILICLEMVFFSVAHLCVFSAEEWEPNYRPKEFKAPSFGITDFAKDVKYIMSSQRRSPGGAADNDNGHQLPLGSLDDDEGGAAELDTLALKEHDDDDDDDDAQETDGLSPASITRRSSNNSYQQAPSSSNIC